MEYLIKIIRLLVLSSMTATLVFAAAHAQTSLQSNPAKTLVPIFSLLLGEEEVDLTLPIANAGANFEVLVGELAQLDGTGSSDPASLPLSFLWSLVTKPDGSSAVLSDPQVGNPSFILDIPGSYEVQLIVDNGIKDSLPSIVTITNTNRVPIASAGDNVIAPLNQLVQLDGSSSSDIDGDPITYQWTIASLPSGSLATLDDLSSESPSFTPDQKGVYQITLLVNDGIADSVIDQMEILAGLEIELNVDDVFFGVGRQTAATLSLDFPAPTQGVDITLDVDTSIIGLTTSQISFDESESEKVFSLAGLLEGMTTLRAFGNNIAEVSVPIEVSGALISLDAVAPLSPSASTSVAISLSDMAPAGGVSVNLETLDTSIATVTPMSLFIAEGQFTPAQNAQVVGVSLGETSLRATGPGFAPDEKDIVVALSAEFDPQTLNVPETLTRNIVLELDAPAPQGGVTFDLNIIGDALFDVQSTVAIAEGETQSQPITLTGLNEGQAILRASAAGFIDADADITVIDAPNVFLTSTGSNSHLQEAIVGVELQDSFRFRLEVLPTSAVDFHVAVPANSGVLLSPNTTTVGSEILVIEDVVSSTTSFISIQGTALGDNVPITIEVFDANTNNPAGYESLSSTVDIDPSGVYMVSADFTTTTFSTNRTALVQAGLLYDGESAGQDGSFRKSQRVRAGTSIDVPMQVDDQNVLALPDGSTGTLTIPANTPSSTVALTPASTGVATVSIASQPAGFTLPTDRDDNVVVTILAPEAFVRSTGSASHLAEATVGLDLQRQLYVGLETNPPTPVDILVSVPANSGTLLSTQATMMGSTQILLEDVNSTRSPIYYLQGTAIGDDVPITVEVFDANTNDLAGYNSLATTADVDPSGIFVATSDYNTTTFSSNRSVLVQSAILYDSETPSRVGERLSNQPVRGGLDLIVPMQVDNVAIASLPNGASDNLTIASNSTQGSISVEPLSPGQATISIASLPSSFVIPSNLDDNTVATITAANAYLRSSGSNSHLAEAVVGIDLQSPHRIGLATSPPSAVDVLVSVPALSGTLLSADNSSAGGTSLIFEDVTTTSSPLFYIQGTALGDDVPLNIDVFVANTMNPIGYNILASTIDVDPSGVYMASGDYTTNTFAPNRNISVRAALLYDDEDIFMRDGQRRTDQAARGGNDISVPMDIGDITVAVLPDGGTGTLVIPAGQNTGTVAVDPLTAGVATISISAQPNANFTLPSNRGDDLEVTVTAPNTLIGVVTAFVGDELQMPVSIGLGATPPNPVDVTVEISSSSVALISDDKTISGSDTVVFSNVTSASVGTIFVQGLTLNGATQIKVSAPGYNDRTADVQVVRSGFRILNSFSNIASGNTRDLIIRSSRLNSNGTFSSDQEVRGGASFDIMTASSSPTVGSVTSPVTIGGGTLSGTSTFTGLAPGSTNISLTQPSGFTPPVGQADVDITVE